MGNYSQKGSPRHDSSLGRSMNNYGYTSFNLRLVEKNVLNRNAEDYQIPSIGSLNSNPHAYQ